MPVPLIFSYGTLQHEPVQWSTFGRRLDGKPDALPAYELTQVGEHANVVSSRRAGASVSGTVFEITDAELAAADDYERRDRYARVAVTLGSGCRAWVYAYAGGETSEGD